MISTLTRYSGHALSRLEKANIWVGSSLLSLSLAVALLSYWISPLLTGSRWKLISPFIHVLLVGVGAILLYFGAKTAGRIIILRVKGTLDNYLLFRLLCRLLALALILFGFMMSILCFLFSIEPESQDSNGFNGEPDNDVDRIWGDSSHHYYDIEPPPSFERPGD
jgi:hypothetical protein